MIFSGLFTSITCKLRIDELSYCKSIFLEVMTVKKQDFIGKIILVGFTWIDRDDNVLEQCSAFGTITRIDDHMLYFDCGDGEEVTIPFDPEHIEKSDPALIYNLHNPQKTITGVDFTSEWTIYHSPEDEGDKE